MKFLMENYGRNMEELNDERWTTDLAFIVCECHLNSLSKVLKGKDTVITEMCDNIEAFNFKPRLWENQSGLRNVLHFPHLKFLDTLSRSFLYCLFRAA